MPATTALSDASPVKQSTFTIYGSKVEEHLQTNPSAIITRNYPQLSAIMKPKSTDSTSI